MNKGNCEVLQSDAKPDGGQAAEATSNGKAPPAEGSSPEHSKNSDSEEPTEEYKEEEDFKALLKSCYSSKTAVLIKPNVSNKWVADLKAKIEKIQSN